METLSDFLAKLALKRNTYSGLEDDDITDILDYTYNIECDGEIPGEEDVLEVVVGCHHAKSLPQQLEYPHQVTKQEWNKIEESFSQNSRMVPAAQQITKIPSPKPGSFGIQGTLLLHNGRFWDAESLEDQDLLHPNGQMSIIEFSPTSLTDSEVLLTRVPLHILAWNSREEVLSVKMNLGIYDMLIIAEGGLCYDEEHLMLYDEGSIRGKIKPFETDEEMRHSAGYLCMVMTEASRVTGTLLSQLKPIDCAAVPRFCDAGNVEAKRHLEPITQIFDSYWRRSVNSNAEFNNLLIIENLFGAAEISDALNREF